MFDRILFNGRIHTNNAEQTIVSAVIIHSGRIFAIGDDSLCQLAGTNTVLQDLKGAVVFPGFIDGHLHWKWTSIALQSVDVYEVSHKELALERVAEAVKKTAKGQWISGSGWTQDFWPDKKFPQAKDLDQVSPQHPVALQAKSGHAMWVNSLGLKLANITANTPDPEGGEIQRDAAGEPTGILFETAMELVSTLIPVPDVEQLADYMLVAQSLAHAQGLTGIHDFDEPSCLMALQILRERGELGLRVLKQVKQDWIKDAIRLGIRWGFGDDWIRIGSLKMFADGALGPRTASMIEAYEGEPDNFGIKVLDKEEMLEFASLATRDGLPTTIHAIGDLAVHDVLDVFEALRAEEEALSIPRDQRRHRIEHVQIIHPQDAHRLAQLDIIASMQPLHATSDFEMADAYWGDRSKLAYNPRIQLDQGVHVVFGSDSPVDPFDPIKGIHAAVTRQRANGQPAGGWYPEARVSMQEAIHGFTIGPAYAAGQEHQQGRLLPGYFADLVILDQDLYAIEADRILDTKVLATMVDGQWRYGFDT